MRASSVSNKQQSREKKIQNPFDSADFALFLFLEKQTLLHFPSNFRSFFLLFLTMNSQTTEFPMPDERELEAIRYCFQVELHSWETQWFGNSWSEIRGRSFWSEGEFVSQEERERNLQNWKGFGFCSLLTVICCWRNWPSTPPVFKLSYIRRRVDRTKKRHRFVSDLCLLYFFLDLFFNYNNTIN